MLIPSLTLCTIAIAGSLFTPAAAIQPEAGVEVVQVLAKHPAARMVGMWRGTVNAMGRDGQWHEAVALERARWNLAGTAIIVEGFGFSQDPETGERVSGHDAAGLIEWDDADGVAVFHAHRAGEEFTRYTFDVVDDGKNIQWHMEPNPGVSIRFTITLTEDHWLEIGEMSRDGGENWMKFLETNLDRVKDD